MKYISFLFAITLALCTSSCSKENINVRAKSNFLSAISKGYSGITKLENKQVGFDSDKRQYIIKGGFTREMKPIEGKLSFNEKTYDLIEGSFQERSLEHADLFGKKVNISFQNKEGNSIETAFYVPKAINYNFVARDTNDKPIFSVGSSFSWDADEQNSMGLTIIITYEPYFNSPKVGNQKLTRTENYIHTDDTGNYIFKSEDLSDIPDNAVVFVRIVRGNYRVVEVDKEEYLFYGMSETQGFAVKK